MRIKAGDIFAFSVPNKMFGCGHVLLKKPLYIAIFEPLFKRFDLKNLELISSSEISLIGTTLDARFYHKMWKVIAPWLKVKLTTRKANKAKTEKEYLDAKAAFDKANCTKVAK